MAKIRGIKPELWTDEDFVELSPFARLLWVGLWNHACDNGHLQDKSKQIKMRVLPTDDVNCAELLREIEVRGLIERADGWITIPNLSHHQKPHKSWWSTCDMPGCELPDGASHAPNNRGATVAQPKRNRGATVRNSCATADVDVDVDVDIKPLSDASDDAGQFQEFWDLYGHKVGRKGAEQKWRLALKKSGVTPNILISAARAYIDWQKSEAKHPQYTKAPAVWLNGEHWNDERPRALAGSVRVTVPEDAESPPDGLDDEAWHLWDIDRRERAASHRAELAGRELA